MPVFPQHSSDWLQFAASCMTPLIAVVFVVHLLAFCYLVLCARRELRRMTSDLDDFTRGLRHRSVLERGADLTEQIDAFLADIQDVLETPAGNSERVTLVGRFNVLDERRRHLRGNRFDTLYTICRTMIEAYPMAGILGTILSIGGALQADNGATSPQTISTIVQYFGTAIWSTFAGLIAAMLLMFVNSVVEASFLRLQESRRQVRETIARAKRELAMTEREVPA
jgi:biopolymer transport protein ExbB/TolQ